MVGLKDEYNNGKNSVDDNIYFDNERENNLKLERIGIPSPIITNRKKRKINYKELVLNHL